MTCTTLLLGKIEECRYQRDNSIYMYNLQLAPPVLPTDYHRPTFSQPPHRIRDHLVHNILCALLLINNRSSLTHQEGPRVIHRVVINLITQCLEIMLDGNGALGREFLDLRGAVLLPVLDVGVHADAEGTAGEDDGADVVVEARGPDGFLVGFGRAGFVREDESGPDPDGAGS